MSDQSTETLLALIILICLLAAALIMVACNPPELVRCVDCLITEGL